MSNFTPFITVNGDPHQNISPLDRGFNYGDGVFETARIVNGAIPLWQYHLDRLTASCQRLAIPLDTNTVTTYQRQLLKVVSEKEIDNGIYKLIVTRGAGGRGYQADENMIPTVSMGIFPLPSSRINLQDKGASVRLCRQRLSENRTLAGLKHLNKLEHVLARQEWSDEFAEGILRDLHGNIIEGIVSNVFVITGKDLITPSLEFCGVEGVMRRVVIEELSSRCHLNVLIKPVSLECLQAADEIFLTNSVFGLWPVNTFYNPENNQRMSFSKRLQIVRLQATLKNFFHDLNTGGKK